jgi:uncharacterized protein YecE (DUF72 family)
MSGEIEHKIYIGTCGYSYPGAPPNGWGGVFYPGRGKRRIDELEFYAGYFNAVEINSSFYRPASAATVRGWLKKTPDDFIFTAKAWQKFTHPAKLGGEQRGRAERWDPFDRSDIERFSEGIQPLMETRRLGALLFQYPSSFVCDPANLARLEATLSAFANCPKVVELRHHSWSDRRIETDALLNRLNTTWAFIDEPKFASSIKQQLTAPGDIAYLRLHGRNQDKWWTHHEAWERYDYFYRAENIKRLAAKLTQLTAKSPQSKAYVFFNNHARGQAVANALMLQGAVNPSQKQNVPLALIEAFPDLKDFIASGEAGPPQLDRLK